VFALTGRTISYFMKKHRLLTRTLNGKRLQWAEKKRRKESSHTRQSLWWEQDGSALQPANILVRPWPVANRYLRSTMPVAVPFEGFLTRVGSDVLLKGFNHESH
jgi:hypothetical protein